MSKVYGAKTRLAQEIHQMKYRSEGETFKEAQTRFATTLADNPAHFYAMREVLLEQRFMGGGRTQLAVGSPMQTTAFNCFVAATIEDDFAAIMKVAAEAGETMRKGGGIGYDFSTLRPKGDMISTLGSPSSGVVSFMGIFDALCQTVSSAGHRRGAQMGVLRIDHPDIEEFIRAKQNSHKLTAFNISIGITDEFMECMLEGKSFALRFGGRVYKRVDAHALWEQIMRSTWDWAEPGVLFIDRINAANNLYYCETICATNPCLHGDSLIETTEGTISIKHMNRPYQVYTMAKDGQLTIATASPSWISKHGAVTVEVTLDTGKTLICTPDHMMYTNTRGWLPASHLTLEDRVGHLARTKKSEVYSRVKLNVNNHENYKPEHRFVAGGGTSLLEGYDVHHLDGDTFNNKCSNLEVLPHAVHSTLTNTGADKSSMKRDALGQFTTTTHKKCKVTKAMPANLKSNLTNQFSGKVVSITWPTERADVYDITVKGTHNLIANFMVVHNCGEQPLPPHGACLLGSYNLTKYVVIDDAIVIGKKRGYFNVLQLIKDIPIVTRAMDNIHENTTFPLPAQAKESHDKRRMGIGVTGLANAVEALGFPYGSEEFLETTASILRVIRDETYRASIELAIEKGAFPLYHPDYLKGEFIKTLPQDIQEGIAMHGIRNSHLLSIAPTGTISLTADNVSGGIEPAFSMGYTRDIQTADGTVTEHVEDYGLKYFGVRGKTANECTADEHLAVLALATKYVDSACSKTVNVSPTMEWEDFKGIYVKAWQLKCKGVTTFNSGGKRFGILNSTDDDSPAKACYIDPETGSKDCS